MSYEDRRREKELDGQELDDSPGHGSTTSEDDLIDGTDTLEHRGEAATTFYARDADTAITRSDGSKLDYERLWHIQHDHDPSTSTNDSEQKRREQFREMQVLTIGSQIGLNRHLCFEAKAILERIELEYFGSIKEEAAILAAITLVCNRNNWWVQRERKYLEMKDNLGVSEDHVRQSRQIIKEQLNM